MSKQAILRTSAQMKDALARRDRDGTNQAVTALLKGRMALGDQWLAISRLMQLNGEFTLASRAIDEFIATSADKPRARYSKVVLLTQFGRLKEAHDLLSTLPADVPDLAGHAYVLGNTSMTLGAIEEARHHLLTALKHRPGWGAAWLSLATATSLVDGPIGEQLIAEEPAAERHHPADRARYCYARGKLHADRGEHAASFAAFARGAALLRAQTPYSRSSNEMNARMAMTGYSPAFFSQRRDRGMGNTFRPIFVTGLPRSGTTLVEQILTSHSSVADGGELNLAQHMAVAAGGVSGDHVAGYLNAGGSLEALGNLYLHLLAERFGADGRFVDKTIDVSRCLGLIAAALPDAPLIWMRRDPLDNAWSCFRTFFIHGVAWSYDLNDIAHHFKLEDELMAFWKDQLGDRLLVVPYAALVDDPAGWTARLLAHCGLTDEAAPYTPHLTQRRVATASALQVRRPINRDGLGVAVPYRGFLQPFVDAYGK